MSLTLCVINSDVVFTLCVMCSKNSVLKYKQKGKTRRTFSLFRSLFLMSDIRGDLTGSSSKPITHIHELKSDTRSSSGLILLLKDSLLSPLEFLPCLMEAIKSVTFGSLA